MALRTTSTRAALHGRYDYATAPDDVFRRHDNCTCTVTYECGRQRQDVWSKRKWEASESELRQRRELSESSKPKVYRNGELRELSEQSKPKVFTHEEARAMQNKVLGIDKSAESGIIDNENNSAVVISMQYFANKNISKMKSPQLMKSINSWSEQIQIHQEKIAAPEKFFKDWDNLDQRYRNGLLKHWEHEIKVFSNDIQEALDELKKRGE